MLPTKHVTPALLSCWCQVACGTGSLLVLLPFWLSDFSWNTDMSLQTHMCLMLKQRILVLKTSRRLRKKATSDKHILYTILWTVIRRWYLLQVINMFWGITLNGEDRIIYIYIHAHIYICRVQTSIHLRSTGHLKYRERRTWWEEKYGHFQTPRLMMCNGQPYKDLWFGGTILKTLSNLVVHQPSDIPRVIPHWLTSGFARL